MSVMLSDTRNLVTWFQGRPLWIQEAARRLLTKENLTPSDLSELAAICRQQGAEPEMTTKSSALPASAFARKTSGVALRLNGISEVKGVDALNPRSPLTFNDESVTIVYGGTGVGKSGYIRILNNVCGSKNRRKLLGNVFQGNTGQSCKIRYTLNGTTKEIVWQPSDGLQVELAALEIYDSECGQVYVNSENEVTFEPWLLGFFQHLIDACGAVERILETEISALPSKKPAMPVELAATQAATWYAQITAETNPTAVAQWCDWSPTLKKESENLNARLLEKNPAEQARQLRTRKTALERLSKELVTIRDGLTAAVASTLLSAKKDAATKRKAASDDATKVFDQAPLDGVGLDSWKLLWEQARAYSEEVAYRTKKFPFTGEDARCVLCQQSLGEDAKVRLVSFEKFVKGELESQAKQAEDRVAELLEKLPKTPPADDFTTRLATLGLDDETLAQRLQQFRDQAQARRDALRVATSEEQVPSTRDPKVLDDLVTLSESLETQAKAFDEDSKHTDRTELKRKTRELEARKWLSEQKESVEAEIARLKTVAALEAAQKLTNTTALSKKKSDLAEVLVSDAFIQRFNNELRALSAARIQVELVKTRTDKGHVYHQIQLKNAKVSVPTSEVLSEGERRAVSISAFLADVEGIEANTPVVFDDPITSLDQDFEESVVARLVVLARKRQVIVFTHRLSMLTLLEDSAKLAGIETRSVGISREPWGTGEPGETPFAARKPERVLNSLLNERLARARKTLTDSGKAEYDIHAKAICSEVRILVERLVEDTLLNEVVRRFRRAVQTQNKIGGLARIKPEDCQLIDELMTKYSRYEHSQPNEAPVSLPEPDELAADLTRLQTWLKEFSSRATPKTSAGIAS